MVTVARAYNWVEVNGPQVFNFFNSERVTNSARLSSICLTHTGLQIISLFGKLWKRSRLDTFSTYVTEKSEKLPWKLSKFSWLWDPIEDIPSKRFLPLVTLFKGIGLAHTIFQHGHNQKLVNYCALLKSNIIPCISEFCFRPTSSLGYCARLASAIHYFSIAYFKLIYNHPVPTDNVLVQEIDRLIKNLEGDAHKHPINENLISHLHFENIRTVCNFLMTHFPLDPEMGRLSIFNLQVSTLATRSLAQQGAYLAGPVNSFENLRVRLVEPWEAFDGTQFTDGVPGPQIDLKLSKLFSDALIPVIPPKPGTALPPPKAPKAPTAPDGTGSAMTAEQRIIPRYTYSLLSPNDEFIELHHTCSLEPLIDILRNLKNKLERELSIKTLLDGYYKIDVLLAIFSFLNLFDSWRKSSRVKILETIVLILKYGYGFCYKEQ
jgi:hypothetical protein